MDIYVVKKFDKLKIVIYHPSILKQAHKLHIGQIKKENASNWRNEQVIANAIHKLCELASLTSTEVTELTNLPYLPNMFAGYHIGKSDATDVSSDNEDE